MGLLCSPTRGKPVPHEGGDDDWGFERSQVKNVGAGLLAKAVCQSVHLVLKHCLRELARSHIWICCVGEIGAGQLP